MSVRIDFPRQEHNYYRLLAKIQKNTQWKRTVFHRLISTNSTTELIFLKENSILKWQWI